MTPSPAPFSRRRFLRRATVVVTALSAPKIVLAARSAKDSAWTIGCLNRPWVKWSADETLDGLKAAGYRVIGLQTPTPSDPFAGSKASDAYLAALKQKLAARDLIAIQGRLSIPDTMPQSEATADIRRQIDNARALDLKILLNTGTSNPERYETWYSLMAYGAKYGADKGIQVVIKPHGGITATASDVLRCMERINHPNLGVWYDAGNILHYTGKDPLVELEPLLPHMTAFVAKDCAGQGGEVMLQFGSGKIDFPSLFRRLNKANFKGPIMVESCAVGATAAATTSNAKANREFLEKVIGAL